MSSIDELSIYDDSYDRSISVNAPDGIWDGSQIHPDINTSDSRFKIYDRITKMKIDLKVAYLSEYSIVKVCIKYLRLL